MNPPTTPPTPPPSPTVMQRTVAWVKANKVFAGIICFLIVATIGSLGCCVHRIYGPEPKAGSSAGQPPAPTAGAKAAPTNPVVPVPPAPPTPQPEPPAAAPAAVATPTNQVLMPDGTNVFTVNINGIGATDGGTLIIAGIYNNFDGSAPRTRPSPQQQGDSQIIEVVIGQKSVVIPPGKTARISNPGTRVTYSPANSLILEHYDYQPVDRSVGIPHVITYRNRSRTESFEIQLNW